MVFGMILERAAAVGPGGAAPALWVGKMFLLAFHFLTEFRPSQLLLPRYLPGAASLPPDLSPLGSLSKEEFIS